MHIRGRLKSDFYNYSPGNVTFNSPSLASLFQVTNFTNTAVPPSTSASSSPTSSVSSPPSSSYVTSVKTGFSPGAIAGSVIGAIVGLSAIVAIFIIWRRRKNRRDIGPSVPPKSPKPRKTTLFELPAEQLPRELQGNALPHEKDSRDVAAELDGRGAARQSRSATTRTQRSADENSTFIRGQGGETWRPPHIRLISASSLLCIAAHMPRFRLPRAFLVATPSNYKSTATYIVQDSERH